MPGTDSTAEADQLSLAATFLREEADLLDERRYTEWEALWADTGEYWVPASAVAADALWELSIIHDDRGELRNRIRRLMSGVAYTQEPPSQLRRTVSNVRVGGDAESIEVISNFVLFEYRRSTWTLWAGRCEHRLARRPAGVNIERKVVRLVGAGAALPALQFLP